MIYGCKWNKLRFFRTNTSNFNNLFLRNIFLIFRLIYKNNYAHLIRGKYEFFEPKRISCKLRFLFLTFQKILQNILYTVKPVYNDHHWDPKRVFIVDKWWQFLKRSFIQ